MHYAAEIAAYIPRNEQEQADRDLILELMAQYGDTLLTRECRFAHLTSSGFIVNEAQDKTLMAYHNIYKAWAWTGGHADGQTDLLQVALQEAREETGIVSVQPLFPEIAGIDILTVPAHIKKGKFVSGHLHLSVSYLLVAQEGQVLTVKPDENSGVKWLPLDKLSELCGEPEMIPVYDKLVERMRMPICR